MQPASGFRPEFQGVRIEREIPPPDGNPGARRSIRATGHASIRGGGAVDAAIRSRCQAIHEGLHIQTRRAFAESGENLLLHLCDAIAVGIAQPPEIG